MGEPQLTIRDYLRQQSACDQQLSAGHGGKQAPGAGQIGGAILPMGLLSGSKSKMVHKRGKTADCTQTDPDWFLGALQVLENNDGGDDGTRTRNMFSILPTQGLHGVAVNLKRRSPKSSCP